jgi:hypothetical protein
MTSHGPSKQLQPAAHNGCTTPGGTITQDHNMILLSTHTPMPCCAHKCVAVPVITEGNLPHVHQHVPHQAWQSKE